MENIYCKQLVDFGFWLLDLIHGQLVVDFGFWLFDLIHRQLFKDGLKKKQKSNKVIVLKLNSKLQPEHIIQVILSKLPLFNWPICRLVCKAWNDVVLSSNFLISTNCFFLTYTFPACDIDCIELDLKPELVGSFKLVLFESSNVISVINSCRGILCFLILQKREATRVPSHLCILNLVTNYYVDLSAPALSGGTYRYGLGFSPKTKQYKMARTSFLRDHSSTLVEMYAFDRILDWRIVAVLPSLVIECNGVYFDGGLYWVGNELLQQPYHSTTKAIYRLDVENGKLEKLLFPQNGGSLYFFLGVFNGTLYLTISAIRGRRYHVWKMEEDCEWTKDFALSKPKKLKHPRGSCQLQPIKSFKDGKILCLLDGLNLIKYDPKTKKVQILPYEDDGLEKRIWVDHIHSSNFNSFPNNLVGMF